MKKKSKRYKTFTALTAATVAASVIVPVASANVGFSDVTNNNTHYDAINSLVERGIVKGFEDGTFRPSDNVTRGQAAKIIAGVLGLDTVNVKNPGFKDIPTSHQYYGAIAALANAGIISGYEDGTYRSGKPVQRNHMAKIIAGAFNLEASSGATTPFTDVRSDYKKYITALYESGVTTGKTTTIFDGTSNVTRGQLASFVVRAENIESNTISLTVNEIDGNTIITSGKQYEVSTVLQGIFSEANNAALKGAKVTAKVENGKIVAVDSLELTTAGKQGALVTLDAKNAKVAGNLVVNADFVEVKNLVVEGNVTLTNKVVTEFSANTLTTNGELIIDEADTVASLSPIAATVNGPKVNLKKSAFKNIQVKRNGVVISSDGKISGISIKSKVSSIQIDADVTKVIVDVDVKITVTGKGNIDEVIVEKAKEIALQVAGEIAKLVVNNSKAKVEIGTNIKIKTLVVPKDTKAESIITNYNSVKNKIDKVEQSDGSVQENKNTGGSSNSSAKKFAITFTSADGAEIIVTNNKGKVVEWQNKLTNGTYNYKITKQDYKTVEGTFTINGKAVTIEVKLEKIKQPLTIVEVPKNIKRYQGETLPSQVEVTMSDGSKVLVDITWPAGTNTNTVGTKAVKVLIDGKEYEVNLVVEAKSISDREITSPGTYGPETGIQVIEGNLTITSPDVVLRNIEVTGDLILGQGIGEGNVTLQGVTVKGKTVVNGGGQDSIYFIDSVLATVIVNKNTGAVRIVAQGSTQVFEVQLEAPAILVENELEGDATGFEDITITEAMQSTSDTVHVQLEGSFETINSRATNIRIELDEATDIETLILNAAAQVLGTGVIRTARINADGSTISQRPQNVVLEINGTVTVGGESISESYSDPNTTTAINSVKASNGSISLEMENFVAGLTVADFDISAKLNGEDITLNNLHFDANKQRFTFDSIPLTDNLEKTLEVTIAPNSEKITGEAKTTSFVIDTGFAGRITDIQGVGIPNLTIQFREGVGSTSGEIVGTATTDQYGYYSVNLPAGTYTGEFSSPGYITTYMIGVASSDVFLTDQNETAIRAAASNEVKIMLSWGENPNDLDSHLIGPDPDGTTFHVAYYNREEVENGITYVDLDWDDTDSYGPETTTIRRLVDGEYRFYIHNYSGNYESTLRESGAKVSLFLGNATTPNKVFNVPTGEGEERYWIVFDLVVSNNGQNIEIKEINELQHNEYSLEDLIEQANEKLQVLPTVEEITVENLFEILYLVEEVQEYVLMAQQAGAQDTDFIGLEHLEAVKQKIIQLKEGKKLELIQKINERLAEVPLADTITIENRDEVEALLQDIESDIQSDIYEAYSLGAVATDFVGYENINNVWSRINVLYEVEYANNLLADIPEAHLITIEHLEEVKYKVQNAQYAVDQAKWDGALESDFIGLEKIDAALQKIEALETENEGPGSGNGEENGHISVPLTVALNGDDLELTITSSDSIEISEVDLVNLLFATTEDLNSTSTSDVSYLLVTSDTITVETSGDTIKITLADVKDRLPVDATIISVMIVGRNESGFSQVYEAKDLKFRIENN